MFDTATSGNGTVASPFTLRRLFAVVFKRKWIILLVWAAVVVTVTLGTMMMPDVFEASAKVIVERVYDADKSLLFGLTLRQDHEQYDWINSEIEIISSYPVAARVAQSLKLIARKDENGVSAPVDSGFAFEEGLKQMRGKLTVASAKNSNVINVRYEAEDARQAALIANQFIAEYMQYRGELYDESSSYKFFERQMQIANDRLRELEQNQVAFKQEQEVLSPEQQRQILLSKLSDYESSLTATRTKRIGKETKLMVINEQLRLGQDLNVPSTEASDSPSREKYIAKLRSDLLDMEVRREDLLQKFTPEYEEVLDLDRQITATKSKVEAEIRQIVTMEEMSLRALRAEEEVLQKSIVQIQQEMRSFARKEYELSQISRGIDDNREVFSMLLKQREEARLALAKHERDVTIKVVSPALAPLEPLRPKRSLNVMLAIAAGLLAGLGLAFLIELLDRSFESTEELERILALPALGTVRDTLSAKGEARDRYNTRKFYDGDYVS